MNVAFALLVVLLAPPASAPASRPTSQTTSEVADLRRIIDGLRRQVATLKTENTSLQQQLTAATDELASLRAKQPRAPRPGDFIRTLMSVAQVEAVIGKPGRMLSEDAWKRQEYIWDHIPNSHRVVRDNPPPNETGTYTLRCQFQENQLASYDVSEDRPPATAPR